MRCDEFKLTEAELDLVLTKVDYGIQRDGRFGSAVVPESSRIRPKKRQRCYLNLRYIVGALSVTSGYQRKVRRGAFLFI